MKAVHLSVVASACATILGVFASPLRASGLPVFDVANYAQNLLQASRALAQINNQVKSLQNETAMLQDMGRNLRTISFPQLEQMTAAMQRIDQLMGEARGIDFKVTGLDQRISEIFPGELQQVITGDQRVKQARAELDSAMAAYRQSMHVQAQVAENIVEDATVVHELADRSQNSDGALQVGQAANQLLALSVKQQLQLQELMASEFREQALERARRVQAEEDGQANTRWFLQGRQSSPN